MIKIYTVDTCSSCKKVKKWFLDEGIPFIEKRLFVVPLKENEIMEMLAKSENGTDDIVSKNSKIIKEGNIDVNNMTTKELVKFIIDNPSILKRPIIVDDNRIQVGFNADEIQSFIPHAKRLAMWACNNLDCPKYDTCESPQEKVNS